jgi:hypothetical protein
MSNTEPSDTLPPPSLDVEMTDTSPTAGQERVGNTEEPQPADNGGTDEDEQIESYNPDDKKKEIFRIWKLPDWAHYEILEVDSTTNTDTIVRNWRKKAKLVHSDQNSDKYSKEVTQSK